MSTVQEIRIREAFSHIDTPDEPRSFEFFGPRDLLAAHILGTDAPQWDCVDYVILATGEHQWAVWRR
jgi:hypothetical protein